MFLQNPSISAITSAVAEIKIKEGEGIFIQLAEQNPPDVLELQKALNQLEIQFFGGIFPGIIYNKKHYKRGVILIKFPMSKGVYEFHGLDSSDYSIPPFASFPIRTRKSTAIVLVDGLLEEIAPFLNKLNDVLGQKVNFIGAGAGFSDFKASACLFSADNFFNKGALVAFVDQEVQLGVQHGWKKLAGPIVATETDNNKMSQLNWEPAFSVYASSLGKAINKQITTENLLDYGKIHPLGMYKEGNEDIVRELIKLDENGTIVCLGDVPENSVLYILQSNRAALIQAAKQATQDSLVDNDKHFSNAFIVDCISRPDFLKDDFDKEIEAVQQEVVKKNKDVIPFGVLSLGEISSYGRGLLEFFNKTIVVGIFN